MPTPAVPATAVFPAHTHQAAYSTTGISQLSVDYTKDEMTAATRQAKCTAVSAPATATSAITAVAALVRPNEPTKKKTKKERQSRLKLWK